MGSIDLLLGAGVALARRDYHGRSPLHIAYESGALLCAARLELAGADPSSLDDMNRLPHECLSISSIIVAATANRADDLWALSFLMMLGCDVEHRQTASSSKGSKAALNRLGENRKAALNRLLRLSDWEDSEGRVGQTDFDMTDAVGDEDSSDSDVNEEDEDDEPDTPQKRRGLLGKITSFIFGRVHSRSEVDEDDVELGEHSNTRHEHERVDQYLKDPVVWKRWQPLVRLHAWRY